MGRSPSQRGTDDDVLPHIVSAARRCFERNGVEKTRMQQIAEEAGTTRQKLYRHASGRGELVRLAILDRSREIAQAVSEQSDLENADLRAAFTEAIVGSVLFARDDAEFGYLTEATPRVDLNLLVASKDSAMHENVRVLFDPLLRRARYEGLLRTDVAEDDIVEWLQGVLTLLTPRIDLDRPALERMLAQFLLPVVFDERS